MTVFFTSDTHFGDHRVIWMYQRPFRTVADMNAALVQSWKAVVTDADTVWHLGDFAVRSSVAETSALLRQLPGRKNLVIGNNDKEATTQAPEWDSVAHYVETVVDGTAVVLCHYPFRTWNGMYRKALNLHGHSHGRLSVLKGQYDVGVDVFGFRPVTLREIVESRPRQARAGTGRSAGAS